MEIRKIDLLIDAQRFVLDGAGLHLPKKHELDDRIWSIRFDVVDDIISKFDHFFVETKTFNFSRSSYGYKHQIERSLKSGYCSNGEFILAMVRMGIALKVRPQDIVLNPSVAISDSPVRARQRKAIRDGACFEPHDVWPPAVLQN